MVKASTIRLKNLMITNKVILHCGLPLVTSGTDRTKIIAVPNPNMKVPIMGRILEVRKSSGDYTNVLFLGQTIHRSSIQWASETATSNRERVDTTIRWD
jgi:hypothetical protein